MNDLIDRQAVIDALDKRFDSIPMEQTAEILQLRKDLRELPSAQPKSYREGYQAGFKDAQPERKKGKWTKISPASIYECSVCGQTVMTDDIEAYSYCHGCGVKMEVSEK